MNQRTLRRRARQKEFAQATPRHYCTSCMSMVYEDDSACLDCGVPRQATGWADVRDCLDPFLGRTLDGRYLITRRIGRGATGQVYRAVSFGVAREFAIKFIHAGADSSRSGVTRERLEREIEAMGRLRNPHIVPFYEVFELYDQHLGVVMDYVPGRTLQDLIDVDGPLDVMRACNILRQIGNGLHEAHEFGLIHRDMKPDNVMVELLPAGDDFIHILDFGIVRFAETSQTSAAFVGTPLYASPEQVLGQALDRRADIYALGGVLFFCLTGRAPFEADTIDEVLKMQTDLAPPALSEVSDGVVENPDVQMLVSEMLSKSRFARPANLHDVVKRLDKIIHQTTKSAWDLSAPSGIHDKPRGEIRADLARERQTHESSSKADPSTGGHRYSTGVVLDAAVVMMVAAHDATPLILLSNGHVVRVSDRVKEDLGRSELKATALTLAGGVLLGTADGTIHHMDRGIDVYQDIRNASVNALCADRAGTFVYCGLESGRVQSTQTIGPDAWVWKPVLSGPPVTALTCDAKGQRLAVARKTREVEVFEARNFRAPVAHFSVPDQVVGLTLSDDGYLIGVHMRDGTVAIYESGTSNRLILVRPNHPIDLLSFHSQEGLHTYWTKDLELWAEDMEQDLH